MFLFLSFLWIELLITLCLLEAFWANEFGVYFVFFGELACSDKSSKRPNSSFFINKFYDYFLYPNVKFNIYRFNLILL